MPFPLFSQENGVHLAFFALWPRGRATDREKRGPAVVVYTLFSLPLAFSELNNEFSALRGLVSSWSKAKSGASASTWSITPAAAPGTHVPWTRRFSSSQTGWYRMEDGLKPKWGKKNGRKVRKLGHGQTREKERPKDGGKKNFFFAIFDFSPFLAVGFRRSVPIFGFVGPFSFLYQHTWLARIESQRTLAVVGGLDLWGVGSAKLEWKKKTLVYEGFGEVWGKNGAPQICRSNPSRIQIRTRRIGANPEKSDLVNFRGPD